MSSIMNDSELRLGENGKGWYRLNRRGTTQQESKSLQWPQAGQDGIVRAETRGKDVQHREPASDAARIK